MLAQLTNENLKEQLQNAEMEAKTPEEENIHPSNVPDAGTTDPGEGDTS